jgi:hypothetical protein
MASKNRQVTLKITYENKRNAVGSLFAALQTQSVIKVSKVERIGEVKVLRTGKAR